MKKFLPWLIVAVLVFVVARNPAGSASAVRSLWAGLVDVGSAFGTFISHLASG